MTEGGVLTETGPAENRWRPTVRTIFFGIVLVVLIGYTEMAFELEWRTQAGRIGPGFFPRIVGLLGIVIALGAVVGSMRPGAPVEDESGLDEDEIGGGDLGRHPFPLAVAVGASALFLVTLTSLGAILSSAVFMFGMLWLLNRGSWVLNLVLSILVPLGLYLLFQTALNAGLPGGLLPRF